MSPKVKVRKVGMPAAWLVDSPTNADQVQPKRFTEYSDALDYALNGKPGKAGRITGALSVGSAVNTSGRYSCEVMA